MRARADRWWPGRSVLTLVVVLAGVGCGSDDPTLPPVTVPDSGFTKLATVLSGPTDASLLRGFRDAAGIYWVASSEGNILRYDGSHWTTEPVLSGGLAIGVWGPPSGGELLAVAGRGLFSRVSGRWQSRDLPATGSILLGIWGWDQSHVWIGGTNGMILFRSDSTWVRATVPVTDEIWGMDVSDPNSLLAVGQNGAILSSSDSGRTWVKENSPTSFTLFAVARGDDGTAVAVGSAGTVVVSENGNWRLGTSPGPLNLFDIKPDGAGTFLAVGDGGTLVHGDGDSWQRLTIAGARENLRAIIGPPGQRLVAGWSGTVLSQASGWMNVLAGGQLYGITIAPDGDALTVGTGGLAYRRRNGNWSQVAIPSIASLYGVAGPSANDRLVVGDSGVAMHFDGAAWTAELTPAAAFLRSVWYDGTHALAVGNNGTTLVRDGANWLFIQSSTLNFLRRVAGPSWDQLYVVGDHGTLLRWDGTSFTALDTPTDQTLRGIYVAAPDDIWLVGDGGVILRGHGSNWTSRQSPTTGSIRAVREIAGVIYIVGALGEAWRLDGNEWFQVANTQRGFWLDLAGDSTMVAVGEFATVAVGK